MPGHLIAAPAPSASDLGPEAGDSLEVFVPAAPSPSAAAIVDLDGNLVGAIVRGGEGRRVFSAESLYRAVARLRAHPTCRSIEVADLDPAVRRLLHVEAGVAVERVAREAFGPAPSIRAGDVLVEWVYGTGFPAIESALWVRFPWGLLLGLFAAEMVANCATLGSGGSGGVFAPSLYMGAMLGGALGTLAHALFPGWTGGAGAYAMVGMAAFFAAAAKAPTTALLILFEMTNDYRIMLPLMAATVASVSVSHRLLAESIYALKLHRRGIAFPYSEADSRG
jgi:hypothetical protein